MDGPQLRTLNRALAAFRDSKPRLAAALGISQDDLETYLAGKKPMPQQVFIDALDIVAGTNPKNSR